MLDISKVRLASDTLKTLNEIYQEAKEHNPNLTETSLFETIVSEWLEPYRKISRPVYIRGKVVLKNNLKTAIKLTNKSILEHHFAFTNRMLTNVNKEMAY